MELSISPVKGDCGVEAGSEIRISAWYPEVDDATSVDWNLEANPADYNISRPASFDNGLSSTTVKAPKSTEYPLRVSARIGNGEVYSSEFPVVSGHPEVFAIGHQSGVENEGASNCTRVTVEISDRFGNPISDDVLVTVSLTGEGSLIQVDQHGERTSPAKNGRSVFYLDEETLLPHDRYTPKVTIMVEGPVIKELNLRTWELEDHQRGHVVIR